MPMIRCHIAFVDESRTRVRDVRRFEIYTTEPFTDTGHQRLATVNQFRAALCKEAARLGLELEIGWRDTKYGPEAITVERVAA